jgi:CheY-like chemotaxis protein
VTGLTNRIAILVVDDDASIRTTIAAFLEQEGFRVQTAANGAEALDRIQRDPPTLILTDMLMPIMDGWTLAQELRARQIDVPLIVMTPARNAREWAQEVGATAYISKPVSLPALISRIDQLCA